MEFRRRKNETLSFIHDILARELKKRDGKVAALARDLEISPGTLRQWIDGGSEPNAKYVQKILEKTGGDITRALPDWQPSTELLEAHASETRVIGEVTAGHATITDQPSETGNIMDRSFRDSPYWGYTQGITQYLRVVGNSMEPTYPERSLLAVRQPHNTENLPNGTPVVFINRDGETTFKLYSWNDQYQRVFATPINDEFQIQIFKPEEIRIQLIIVGVIQYIGIRPPRAALNRNLTETKAGPPYMLKEPDEHPLPDAATEPTNYKLQSRRKKL